LESRQKLEEYIPLRLTNASSAGTINNQRLCNAVTHFAKIAGKITWSQLFIKEKNALTQLALKTNAL